MRELQAIGELTARARDPSDPVHAALTDGIAASSGLHPTSVKRLVELWANAWQLSDLESALYRGLGANRVSFRPIGTVAIVAPGNLCVATWQALVEALLVGNRVSVRVSSGDPRAARNFQAALALIDGGLAARMNERIFARGDHAAWKAWLADAHALLVYGGDAAIGAVLDLAADAQFGGRMRLHGHYESIGVLATALAADASRVQAAAMGWAQDALLADGRGCMSLRALWLVGPIDRAARLRVQSALAVAFATVAAELPAGRLDPAWEAERQMQAELHAFDAAVDGDLWLERGAGWTILGTHGPISGTAKATGPGARTLRVYEASDADDLRRQLSRWQGKLSTASLAVDEEGERVLDVLDDLKVHRTCAPGRMQAPPADRAPDGHPPFTGLVRLRDRA